MSKKSPSAEVLTLADVVLRWQEGTATPVRTVSGRDIMLALKVVEERFGEEWGERLRNPEYINVELESVGDLLDMLYEADDVGSAQLFMIREFIDDIRARGHRARREGDGSSLRVRAGGHRAADRGAGAGGGEGAATGAREDRTGTAEKHLR